MSVINKMLRDLDDRQAAGTLQVRVQDSRDGIARDTQSIRDGKVAVTHQGAANRAAPWLWGAGALALLGGGLLVWWLMKPATVTDAAPAPQSLAGPVVSSVAPVVSAPKPAASQGAAKNAPVKGVGVSSQPSNPVPKLAAPNQSESSKPSIPAVVPKNFVSPGASTALPSPTPEPNLRMDSLARPGPSSSPAPGQATTSQAIAPLATAPAAIPVAPTPPAPRTSPVMEALAQAQALWSAGSRSGAIELLKDALPVAERSAAGGGGANLAALARELSRMELAEGRAAAALDMLTRLEPSLSGVPDLWAQRGNAAQRLGRHEESANAYLTALKLKPGEPRWMLGAAVSLAAQGQTSAAAEWAEQARAAGAISREVANYLQQLGVPLRER